jgi:hypothetical protein
MSSEFEEIWEEEDEEERFCLSKEEGGRERMSCGWPV